jgi:Helix-turn-helix of DDE superfamily endonuclease
MLFYRAAPPLSRKTLTFVAGIIRRHRISIGSPWRKLNSGQQALLALVCLRKGETFAELAAGFGVGISTAWRYVNEAVALLAARAPKLRTAVRSAIPVYRPSSESVIRRCWTEVHVHE